MKHWWGPFLVFPHQVSLSQLHQELSVSHPMHKLQWKRGELTGSMCHYSVQRLMEKDNHFDTKLQIVMRKSNTIHIQFVMRFKTCAWNIRKWEKKWEKVSAKYCISFIILHHSTQALEIHSKMSTKSIGNTDQNQRES